jgi:hypothetical protein
VVITSGLQQLRAGLSVIAINSLASGAKPEHLAQ